MHRLANLQCVTPRDYCILTVIVICATDQPWILQTPSDPTTAQSTSMDLPNKPRCTLPTATASYTNPVPVHTTVPATTPSHPLLSPIMRLRPTLEPSMALHTTSTHRPGAFDPARCGGALQKLSPCGSRLWAVFHAGNSSRCAAVLQVFCRNPARCERNSSPQAALCVSQPPLWDNQIVRFVTKQAPAPQALKFWGGAREGEEGRVLY